MRWMIGSLMSGRLNRPAGCCRGLGGRLQNRVRPNSTTAMASNNPGATAAPDPFLVPPVLVTWLSVFRPCFTAPAWNRVLVLVAGAVLAPGNSTVTQALRVMGLADEPGFRRYHEVLSRARWMRGPWRDGCCSISSPGCCPTVTWWSG